MWQKHAGVDRHSRHVSKRIDSSEELVDSGSRGGTELPFVSVVFLAYNRREPLLVSLRKTLVESGYPRARLEVIVVDNASSDGTAEAVAREYPEVCLIRNSQNSGAPGWNRGFSVASGDFVLIVDDDAYLRAGALGSRVRAPRGSAPAPPPSPRSRPR